LGIPPGGDWYFVLSNPGTLETTQIVNLNASLLMPTPEQRTITITPPNLGKRLMSLPLRPIDTDISSVLSTCAGSYDYVRWYDPSSTADQWKSYSPGRQRNSLTHIDETMGFWINFTSACTWTLTGFPAGSTAVDLRAGWNLVGYPSSVAGYTVAALKADLGLAGVRVESFDPLAPQYNLWRLPDSYSLKLGEGYWVYVPQDCTWLVVA